MSVNLSGKEILFFGPKTFNYENEIVSVLRSMGAIVTFRSDKPSDATWLKALIRLFPRLLWRYSNKIYERWLEENGPSKCDIVFVIKGEGLSPKFLGALRERYPAAKFVFYLWDSVVNVRNVEEKFPYFDSIFSFDPEDCKRNDILRYRPLFFLEKYRNNQTTSGKGCFFIGTLNGDRPAVISRLIDVFPKSVPFDYWLFVRSALEARVRMLVDGALRKIDPRRLLHAPMTAEAVSKHFAASAAILDIEHPRQVGLTMRTFEVLASGKKLITTNKSIADHDFFDSSRVCIIDRFNPVIPEGFLEQEAVPLAQSFFEKNSLRGWVSEVLGGGE